MRSVSTAKLGVLILILVLLPFSFSPTCREPTAAACQVCFGLDARLSAVTRSSYRAHAERQPARIQLGSRVKRSGRTEPTAIARMPVPTSSLRISPAFCTFCHAINPTRLPLHQRKSAHCAIHLATGNSCIAMPRLLTTLHPDERSLRICPRSLGVRELANRALVAACIFVG